MQDAQVGWIAAIIIGGIAGWLAERFMNSNMGVLMNILLGIVGAIVANALLSVFGIVLGGLLMSLLFLGGESVQMTLGLSASLTRIFQGILLFLLLAADFFIFYRLRRIPEHA